MSKQDPYINKLIFSKYLIRKKIGKGSFGIVYQGVNTSTNEKIALKVEKREKNQQGTLENEAMRLVYLQGEGIPKVYCYGNNQSHNLLVEELLGKSLEDIFNSYGKPFSLKTVCVLGIEMIKRIQSIHQKYYIHRDIKPDNFMTGRGENEKNIYIIDFGLAKKYYSVSKAQHIKFTTGKHLIGTARYCARNAHRGYEQGRRDDIESIGYVLMYFLLGVLPWQGLKIKKNEDQFEKIAEKKYTTPFEELTEGQPEEFLIFFKYIDKLNFEDQPNYIYLIGLFQTMIDKYCRECFYDFDWKKDSCTYVSRELKETKNLDASLIVNKNNDASGMDYSYENEADEDDNNNQEGIGKMKKIKRKDVFIGQDEQPIDEEKKMKGKHKDNSKDDRPKRSKSLMNVKKNGKIKKNKKQNINKNLYQTEQKQKSSAQFGIQDEEKNDENSNNQNKENQQNNNYYNDNEQNNNQIHEDKYDNKNFEDQKIEQKNNEGINSIKNDLFDNENKELVNNEERKDDKNENMEQTEEGRGLEHDNNNNDKMNEINDNEDNDINKNLFENTSYDDKDSKQRNRKRNNNDDKENKKDEVFCKCNIF
jgi:serine/threonine protein kinase